MFIILCVHGLVHTSENSSCYRSQRCCNSNLFTSLFHIFLSFSSKKKKPKRQLLLTTTIFFLFKNVLYKCLSTWGVESNWLGPESLIYLVSIWLYKLLGKKKSLKLDTSHLWLYFDLSLLTWKLLIFYPKPKDYKVSLNKSVKYIPNNNHKMSWMIFNPEVATWEIL